MQNVFVRPDSYYLILLASSVLSRIVLHVKVQHKYHVLNALNLLSLILRKIPANAQLAMLNQLQVEDVRLAESGIVNLAQIQLRKFVILALKIMS